MFNVPKSHVHDKCISAGPWQCLHFSASTRWEVWSGLFPPRIEFFFHHSRALLPTFHTNCPDGSNFTQMGAEGLILPRIPSLTPVLYSTVTHPFQGYTWTQNIPNPQTRTPLFLACTWKWAKWITIWATWTPAGQYVWKVDKTFLELGNFFSFYPDPSEPKQQRLLGHK